MHISGHDIPKRFYAPMPDSTHFRVPLAQSDPMHVDAYDYELPEELIAAHPVAERARSRMLVVSPHPHHIEDRHFQDLPDLLTPGDRLVFNDSKVLPGRLHLKKETGGLVEFLVLERLDTPGWETPPMQGMLRLKGMYRSSNKLKLGQQLSHANPVAPCSPMIVEGFDEGHVIMHVATTLHAAAYLAKHGNLPLPPYIVKRRLQEGHDAYQAQDTDRYQTLFAHTPGAIAAPTAGLHFSRELLDKLDERGIHTSTVTLHVGPGTFKPMKREAGVLTNHQMHSEQYIITDELAAELAHTRESGGRIFAVGTTSARVLETEVRKPEAFVPGTYASTLFLYPGHGFEYCDGLITNFHLPNSTLLTLVASLTGYAAMREIYDHAIDDRYRFYSYGDGMLILP